MWLGNTSSELNARRFHSSRMTANSGSRGSSSSEYSVFTDLIRPCTTARLTRMVKCSKSISDQCNASMSSARSSQALRHDYHRPVGFHEEIYNSIVPLDREHQGLLLPFA